MSKGEIGFVGLGRMGGPMARNLAKAGYELHVFDVDPAAARRAAAPGGVTVRARPREVAAHASVVFTALPNDEIVTATYLGPEGILAGGQRDTTYFDRRGLRIVEGNFEATCTARLMLKDVALAARMAGASLAHMPILRETLAAYGETGTKGWGGQDFSAVTHVVEQRFGRTISGA